MTAATQMSSSTSERHLGVRRAEVRFAATVSIAYLLILIPRIILHVMWRDEWQAWMLAVDGSPSLATIGSRMGYEGHPMGWHLLLWLVDRICHDIAGMKVLHALIATINVFLVAAYAPANRGMRILISLGYFFAFEYAVISRNYALGVLFLFGFAALNTARPSALLRPAISLAFAAQANIYSAMIAGLLWLWLSTNWFQQDRSRPARFISATAIVVGGLLLCAVQLIGKPDRAFEVAAFGPSFDRFVTIVGGLWRSFVPLPITRRDWWNTSFIEQAVGRSMVDYWSAGLGLCLAVISVWMLPRNRNVRMLWIAGAFALVAFGTSFYPGFLRHQGHFFILFLLAWWLGQSTERRSDSRKDARSSVTLFLMIAQVVAGVFASVADCFLPFTSAREVAKYIDTRFPDAAVIGHVDFIASPIAGFRGRPIYSPAARRWVTFTVWNKDRIDVESDDYTHFAERTVASEPGREVILVLSQDSLIAPDAKRFKKLEIFNDSTVPSEQYYLYLFRPAASTQPDQ